ncbi:flagellin [Succinimonas amylolytica]|uniref:flagellin n=1 Tax=Succinimonas amylolytica TaxID=83769 RepID=UPI00037D4251|nr:flagellin [Succinimonas amylolytica]
MTKCGNDTRYINHKSEKLPFFWKLTNVPENLRDARNRIRDADYTTETAEMTRQSILQQVSTSILVNANQKNEIVLSLLQK